MHSRDATVLIDLLWFNVVHYSSTFFRSTMVPKIPNFLVYLLFILNIIIIILFHWPTGFDFNFYFKKHYTALLTEPFRVSVTYLKTHTRQIATQPCFENFPSSSPLHWGSSVYWRSRLRIKLRDLFLAASVCVHYTGGVPYTEEAV